MRDYIRKSEYPIFLLKAYELFGSRAKETYHNGSDIDLTAVGDGLTYNQLMDIAIQIEDLGLLYKVDVLDYQKQKGTSIGAHIDRVGKLFCQA